MNCSDIRTQLTLYSDNRLGADECSVVSEHLAACPVCRERLAELHELGLALRRIRRPEMPVSLMVRIDAAVGSELRTRSASWLPVSDDTRRWMRSQLMPYAVGTLASVLAGLTVLTLMFGSCGSREKFGSPNADAVLLAANRDPLSDGNTITPIEYARTRMDVSRESPSVNPHGALVALTQSLVRGGIKDDEVVVVADVFGNGLARISEIVEPSRDQQAMAELERALASKDPQYAPFVAADLDRRSETMRVVLRFQNVDVPTTRRSRR